MYYPRSLGKPGLYPQASFHTKWVAYLKVSSMQAHSASYYILTNNGAMDARMERRENLGDKNNKRLDNSKAVLR
jgi:hypothetical protein